MIGETFFSSFEFYLSDGVKEVHNEDKSLILENAILSHGGMIISFMNEYVNIIVMKEDEYCSFIEKNPNWAFVHIVSPNWVFDSIANHTILPFNSYSVHPNALFVECYFYIIADSKESMHSLSEVITHFGGTLVFDKNAFITHYVICNTVHTSHSIRGVTSNGISVLSEDDIWTCISNRSRLCRNARVSKRLLISQPECVHPSIQQYGTQFEDTLFLLYIDQPNEYSILQNLIIGNGGEVWEVTHNLDATAIYPIQQTKKTVILISYSVIPLIERICSIFPTIKIRSPYWIYDTVETKLNPQYELLYTPHGFLDMYDYCFTIYCSTNYSYYVRLVESCHGFVSKLLPCSIILAEDLNSIPLFERSHPGSIVLLQWIVDCVQSNVILPFSSYSIKS